MSKYDFITLYKSYRKKVTVFGNFRFIEHVHDMGQLIAHYAFGDIVETPPEIVAAGVIEQ